MNLPFLSLLVGAEKRTERVKNLKEVKVMTNFKIEFVKKPAFWSNYSRK